MKPHLMRAIENALATLKSGTKRVDIDAQDEESGTEVEVTAYWAGTVARIDIKGLKG